MGARIASMAAGAAAGIVLSIALAGCVEKVTRARPAGAQGGTLPEARAKAAAPTAAPVERKLVPLDIRLPRPAFTCSSFRVPPGVETRTGPRPPVMVPFGTRNVALGKPVTASDRDAAVSEEELVTDGDKEATRGNYLELGPGRQWVQIDLGAEHEIHVVLFWHRHDPIAVYSDVVVQVAGDPDIVVGVKTLFNNDDDNSLGLGVGRDLKYFDTYEGKLVEARGVRARYVRLHSNGSTADELNRYTEVEVYGVPAE